MLVHSACIWYRHRCAVKSCLSSCTVGIYSGENHVNMNLERFLSTGNVYLIDVTTTYSTLEKRKFHVFIFMWNNRGIANIKSNRFCDNLYNNNKIEDVSYNIPLQNKLKKQENYIEHYVGIYVVVNRYVFPNFCCIPTFKIGWHVEGW